MRPIVSVIMPVFNAQDYIDAAISSILNQTYSDFELILIDDCGTDLSMEKALMYAEKDRRIKIFRNPINKGIAYSRNYGIKQSEGKYIAIMDDDDWSYPTRFEKQIEFLEEHPEYSVVGGMAQWIDAEGNVIKWETVPMRDSNDIKAMLLFYNIFNNSEVMFKKEIVDKYNISYEDNMLGMEDFKFWIQVSKVVRITNINEVVLQHRMTESNQTNIVLREKKEARKEKFAELQKYSLQLSGFELENEQLQFLSDIFREEGVKSNVTGQEMEKLFTIFKCLIVQAQEKEMDMLWAMKNWFRNIYVEKLQSLSIDDMWR